MEEIIYYRACDGKIFENKDECHEYEKVLAFKEFFHQLIETHTSFDDELNEDCFIEELLAKRSILKAIL